MLKINIQFDFTGRLIVCPSLTGIRIMVVLDADVEVVFSAATMEGFRRQPISKLVNQLNKVQAWSSNLSQ